MTDIWEKIAKCANCTDTSPCLEHEAEAFDAYEAEAQTPSWEQLMKLAFIIATQSPDPSTQNSAFLVTPDKSRDLIASTIAVNEFPRGVKAVEGRWERPLKYQYVEHAERNAIFNASRHGEQTDGLIIVTLFSPCSDCARAIIQSGIKKVVHYHVPISDTWLSSCATGAEMLSEAGVETIEVTTLPEGTPPIRRNGEKWLHV
jgi:dCMP deaminase